MPYVTYLLSARNLTSQNTHSRSTRATYNRLVCQWMHLTYRHVLLFGNVRLLFAYHSTSSATFRLLTLFAFLASFYRSSTKLQEGNVFTSVCHSVHRREGRVSLIPFPSGGCVGGYTLPPPTKGHGTRDPLQPLEGTWDQRYPTPRNHKSGRYVSYWIAFLFLLFATVPVVAWSNI